MNPKRIANLSPLLRDTPIAYYWMGFLMADGHFYDHGAVKLHLSEKDREHIEKFRKFVAYTGQAKSCTMNAMNPSIVHRIMKKFGITHLKTYEPCDISQFEGHLLFSLIVGMFDGDGSIRLRNGSVSVLEMKLHKTWLSNLRLIEGFLYKYLNIEKAKKVELARMRKDGYSVIILSDRYLLAQMKKRAIRLSLPIMSRKWNGIDITYTSISREHHKRLPKIFELIELGLPYKKIEQQLHLPKGTVGTVIYRRKKQNENMVKC